MCGVSARVDLCLVYLCVCAAAAAAVVVGVNKSQQLVHRILR